MVMGASTRPILPDDSGHRGAWKHAIVGSTQISRRLRHQFGRGVQDAGQVVSIASSRSETFHPILEDLPPKESRRCD